MAPFQNYRLGQGGVDVDSSPLHRDPDTLMKGQNAIIDPLGLGGGLRKRPGLVKLNGNAGAGSVLGGINVPFASLADDRPLLLAQQDGSAAEGWYQSSDLFATSALNTDIAAWQDPTVYFPTGGPDPCRMGCFFNGQLFYAGADYTSGTTSPVIRVYNGVDDRQISKITPAATFGIVSMTVSRGALYVLTLDSGTNDSTWVGRVFSLNPNNGQLTQVGNALTTGHIPLSITVHNGLIFVGTARSAVTDEAQVLRINPIDETTWTVDLSASPDDYAITALQSFKGLLYGTTTNGGVATKGKILQRSVAGVWSTVDSTVNNAGTFDGMSVFNGALYAASRSYSTTTSTAVIRKSTDGSSWSTVYNSSSTAGVGPMTVVGLRLFSHIRSKILHTLDGSSWTLATPAGGLATGGALGTLIARGDSQWSDPIGTTLDDTTTTTTAGVTATTLQAVLGPALIYSSSVTLTDAQFRALGLNGAPQVVVPAPGAGKIAVPMMYVISANVTLLFSSSPNLRFQYQGFTTNLLATANPIDVNAVLGKKYLTQTMITGQNSATSGYGENLPIEISTANAAPTSGTTAGGIYITVWYTIATLGSN